MPRVLRQTTVTRDGFHNAFTDLQYWRGTYWVSYRKGSAHAAMDGMAVLATSCDRQRFEEVVKLKTPKGGDNRDPKLFVVSPDRMAMVLSSWEGGYTGEKLQAYISFTANGHDWETPQPILRPGRWLWRIREHDGVYYGLVYERAELTDGYCLRHWLMKSTDLLDWQEVTQVGTDDLMLNESDILWRDNGEAWIIARSETNPGYSYFCKAQAPYTDWECQPLTALIHSPCFLEIEGVVYIAGRSFSYLEGDKTFAFLKPGSLAIWAVEDGSVTPVLRIPTAGDCAYPGWLVDPEGRVCMSYYSQHAYYMGVLEPPCRVVEPPYKQSSQSPNETADSLSAADIYFAELLFP